MEPTVLLDLAVMLAVSMTGHTCAAIDNIQNEAVWAHPTLAGVTYTSTSYSERERIVYRNAPGRNDSEAWVALLAAEAALQEGEPGHKVPLRCVPA